MPNRILREGIISSERIAKLSPAAELFYRKLMSVVDDYGRFDAHPEILRARCYCLQLDRVTAADVTSWLVECGQMTADDSECPLISLYSVKGKKYLQINNFGQRERAERFPPPSLADKSEQMTAYARASNTNTNTPSEYSSTNTSPENSKNNQPENSSGSPGEPVTPALPPEVQPTNGHVTNLALARLPAIQNLPFDNLAPILTVVKPSKDWQLDVFESDFWPFYWRKVDKADALNKWRQKAQTEELADKIVEAMKAHHAYYMAKDPELRPHAATWLHKDRWKELSPAEAQRQDPQNGLLPRGPTQGERATLDALQINRERKARQAAREVAR